MRRPMTVRVAVLLFVTVLATGGLAQGGEKSAPPPNALPVVHTVQASVDFPSSPTGVAIQAEKRPGGFTIPKGSSGAKLTYSFYDPKSDYRSTKLRGSNIYSVTEHRYMDELTTNPNFVLPPGEYKFVVGGQPGALGNLTYTLVPTGPGSTKPPPPPPGRPPRKDKFDKPPTPPLLPGSEEVLLLLPKDFDVLVPDFDISKALIKDWSDSSRGANDGPLVLRFRNGVVSADQQWTAHLRQKGENPHIVEWRFRFKLDGTLRRGVLQGQATYYYEEGIRAIHYPQSKVLEQGEVRGQSDSEGKMVVQISLKKQYAVGYDSEQKAFVDNPYHKAGDLKFELRLPVGQLQSTQKLSEPESLPTIAQPR